MGDNYKNSFGNNLETIVSTNSSVYGEKLIDFIKKNRYLFPSDVQQIHYQRALRGEYSRIRDAAVIKLWQRMQYGTDPEEDARELQTECAKEAINERVQLWRSRENLREFHSDGPDHGSLDEQIVGNLSGEINTLVIELSRELFQDWRTEPDVSQSLRELARLIISRDDFQDSVLLPETFSGLVIAGFGNKQHFPALRHYKICGIYGDCLKYKAFPAETISEGSPAIVKSFAYTNMVDTFMAGYEPHSGTTGGGRNYRHSRTSRGGG